MRKGRALSADYRLPLYMIRRVFLPLLDAPAASRREHVL
jgi:hypothetical protein